MALVSVGPAPLTGLAAAYFEESVRHLNDARILHQNTSYAGAIASSMHAMEEAFKAFLFCELGAPFTLNHRPFNEFIRNDARFFYIFSHLEKQIDALESMAPKPLHTAGARNPEYPYYDQKWVLKRPELEYTQQESESFFSTARSVADLVMNLRTELKGLNKTLPVVS